MAVTMELEESASDSKLHKDSTAKKELRPSSAVSFSKSDHGPGSSSLMIAFITTDLWCRLGHSHKFNPTCN